MHSRLASYKALFLVVSGLLPCTLAKAQCIATSANSGTVATNVDDGGNDWLFPNSALIQNDLYALASAGTTDLLIITDFNFDALSIASDATICGIEVEIDRNGSATTDNIIQLVKDGSTPTGTNQATGTAWPGTDTDTYAAYGGDADLWGTTWSVEDIESENFGVAISATAGMGGAFVDHVTITVYYNEDVAVPVEFSSFHITPHGGEAQLYWSTATEENNDYFTVLRSEDGFAWDSIAYLPGAGDSYATQHYNYTDRPPHPGTYYYRIQQTDFDKKFSYSTIRSVTIYDQKEFYQSLIYPNPLSTSATLTLGPGWSYKNVQIGIYTTAGELVQHYESISNEITIQRGRLEAGTYVCRVMYDGQVISVNNFIIE